MKRALFVLSIFSLVLSFGCKEDEHPDRPQKSKEEILWEQERIPKATELFNKYMEEYGNFDASKISALLQKTLWIDHTSVTYNNDWSEIIGIGCYGTTFFAVCCDLNIYWFHEDGGFDILNQDGGKMLTDGSWDFDPQKNSLTLCRESGDPSKEYTLVAFGEEAFILQITDSYGNKRELYMADMEVEEWESLPKW